MSKAASEDKSPISIVDKARDWASGQFRAQKPAESVCNVFWAGDSRCYLLSAPAGLQQLTEDDLKTKGDAPANLVEDSPMSNFINADVDFVLNRRHIVAPLGRLDKEIAWLKERSQFQKDE
jgi:serine/threonine protein phosphatase PrpC